MSIGRPILGILFSSFSFVALACGDSARTAAGPARIEVPEQPPAPPPSPSPSPSPGPSASAPESKAEAAPPESPDGVGSDDNATVGTIGGAGQTDADAGASAPVSVRSPSLRQGATQVIGRLPPEVIERVVRQNFGRFRLCYENGLRTNPKLAGTISVKFTISQKGDVGQAADFSSTLPDKSVITCVTRGFGNLSFPQPESGVVTVVYPIIFSPGDTPPKPATKPPTKK